MISGVSLDDLKKFTDPNRGARRTVTGIGRTYTVGLRLRTAVGTAQNGRITVYGKVLIVSCCRSSFLPVVWRYRPSVVFAVVLDTISTSTIPKILIK